MPKKALLMLVGGLIGSVALTIALDGLFTRSPGHQWATAVQASATLVLVGVTGVYVWITYRQMRLQATPLVGIRLAAQEQAARQAVGILQRTKIAADGLIRDMPIVDSPGEPNVGALHANESAVFELLKDLGAMAAGLPPPFALHALQALNVSLKGVTDGYLFSQACSLERGAAALEHRDWSWDGARKSYLADVRDPKLDHPEWDDLVKLTTLREAVGQVSKLERDIMKYLQSPVQGMSR